MYRNGNISIDPYKSSYFEWKISNFEKIMSCDRIVRSPNFLFRKKSWHVVIRNGNNFNGGSFGVINVSGSSYYSLHLLDEQGIEMSASGKGNNAYISKAEIKTENTKYIFEEQGGNLVTMQNNFNSCNNAASIFGASINSAVTVIGQLSDNYQPEESLVTASGTASSFCKSCECNGKKFLALSQDLKESYLNKQNCDFKIQVKQQTFEVHKMLLSARSPVFAAMIKNDMSESKSNAVNITDCDPGAFHVFLLYLYSGETEKMDIENVLQVFFIADKYNVDQLKALSVEYMKSNLCVNRFCDIIELAASCQESELLKISKEYFRNNAKEIVSEVNWQSFMKESTTLAAELILLLT